jgi:hypothetical protein
MSDNTSLRPDITLDFKKNRIRIFKRTLLSIGDPEYIHLLVNPEERTLAIMRSERSDLRSYRLPRTRYKDRQYVEITSKSLMGNLLGLCSDMKDKHAYRIYGEIIQNKDIAQFSLTEHEDKQYDKIY